MTSNLKKIKTIGYNLVYLGSGNFVSLLLGFLFNLYIAKQLGVAQYGIFNTVSAFTGLFGFMLFEGYQDVAIRECCGNGKKLLPLLENTIGIKLLLSFTAVACTITTSLFLNYSDTVIVYIAFFSFSLLFDSYTSMIRVVFHIHSEMKFIALTNLIQKLIYIIPAGICIWFKGGVGYLIFFYTISTLLNTIVNIRIVRKHFSISISYRNIVKNLSFHNFNPDYFKKASVLSILGFISYFYSKIDIAMLSWMLTAQDVGIYSAAIKIILPLEMIGRIIRVALFPQFMGMFDTQNQVKLMDLIKVSIFIGICIFPISLLIWYFSETIILFTFGNEYGPAAQILKFLCWLIPLSIITTPFGLSMMACHQEKKLILPNLLRSFCNVLLNYIFINKWGIMGAVYSTAITYTWYYLFINFGYQSYVLKNRGDII